MAEQNVDQDYLQKIKEEHARLGRLVSQLRHMVEGGDQNTVSFRELVERLQAELKEHFEFEEAGGYFTDAVAQAPRLASHAERLEKQHEGLLRLVDQMLELLGKTSDSDPPAADFAAKATQFIEELVAHERAENALVQEAYERDIGDND